MAVASPTPTTPNQQNLLVPALVVVLAALAFGIGVLWQKVEILEKGEVGTGGAAPAVAGAQPEVGPSPLRIEALKAYAKELGLDENKFNSCLDEGKTANLVAADQSYGTSVGVTGTPGFFVNGYLINGALPYSSFKIILDFLVAGGDIAKPSPEVKALIDSQALSATKKQVEPGDAPSKGSANASIKLIEFSDFECPYCSSFFKQTYPSIVSDYIDRGTVQFFYKYFPLSFHPNAQKASEAAECAKEQVKFWEMHDKMFSSQP